MAEDIYAKVNKGSPKSPIKDADTTPVISQRNSKTPPLPPRPGKGPQELAVRDELYATPADAVDPIYDIPQNAAPPRPPKPIERSGSVDSGVGASPKPQRRGALSGKAKDNAIKAAELAKQPQNMSWEEIKAAKAAGAAIQASLQNKEGSTPPPPNRHLKPRGPSLA